MSDMCAPSPAQAQACQPALCPLSRVVAGACVRIKRIDSPPEVARRLREIGFCEEQPVKLLSRQSNLICLVCNARLGISSQLAEDILVEWSPAPRPAVAPLAP